MLVVDPLKRIPVTEILAYPWTNRGLPKYLLKTVADLAPPGVVGTIGSVIANTQDETVVDGLGKIDQAVVLELADAIGVVRFPHSISMYHMSDLDLFRTQMRS